MDVTAGETITIRVGRGGLGTSLAVRGGTTAIVTSAAPVRTYSLHQQGIGISYNGSTSGTTIPGLLQFVSGQDGEFSEITYAQSGPNEYRRIFTGGNGGDSYPNQKGGKGITMTYNAVTGDPLVGGLVSAAGKNGATPGAGGGSSIGVGGAGGAGLVIVHW